MLQPTRCMRPVSLSLASLLISVSACSSSDPGPNVGAGTGGIAGSTPSAGSGGISGGSVAGASGAPSAAGSGGASAGSAGSAGSGGSVAGKDCTPPPFDMPLAKLSETGCMSATDIKKFASKVIPYEVNSPLWSDSADKQRGMVIPVGQKVHIKDCAVPADNCTQGPQDTGKWVFPVGTVMLKNFLFDGKLVETRLFVRHDETTWAGYSYQWNAEQTEATVVPDERRDVMFDTGTRTVPWQYPNRLDCMKCHNAQGGSTLGPETRQMNRMVDGMNQIDRLTALGVFDSPPAKPYAEAYVAPYASQAGMPPASATVEQRVRSYLHANCAFCHRPDGELPPIDLRYDVKFADTHLCNTEPKKGNQDVAGALNLKPGDPSKSIMYLRMAAMPGQGRMPAIATNKVDTDGLKLVGDWITSIKTCP